jgi:hypothetical protein
MLGKLAVIACTMFGFGFAMIPIYRTICEVTGVNSLTQVDQDAKRFAENTQVDMTRVISVEFDANARGPWQLRPRTGSVNAHPGELVTVEYELVNTLDRPAHFACFGLHEWAMVYRQDKFALRHEYLTLRLGSAGTDQVVEENIAEFGMAREEAARDAVEQLEQMKE